MVRIRYLEPYFSMHHHGQGTFAACFVTAMKNILMMLKKILFTCAIIYMYILMDTIIEYAYLKKIVQQELTQIISMINSSMSLLSCLSLFAYGTFKQNVHAFTFSKCILKVIILAWNIVLKSLSGTRMNSDNKNTF